MTERRKITVELIGDNARDAGILSGIDELEVMGDDGLTIINRVTRSHLDCGHRYAGKDQAGLATCCVGGEIYCIQCVERDKRSFCEGCGRFVCPVHRRVGFLMGTVLCRDCGLWDVIKQKLKKGGVMEWLSYW